MKALEKQNRLSGFKEQYALQNVKMNWNLTYTDTNIDFKDKNRNLDELQFMEVFKRSLSLACFFYKATQYLQQFPFSGRKPREKKT